MACGAEGGQPRRIARNICKGPPRARPASAPELGEAREPTAAAWRPQADLLLPPPPLEPKASVRDANHQQAPRAPLRIQAAPRGSLAICPSAWRHAPPPPIAQPCRPWPPQRWRRVELRLVKERGRKHQPWSGAHVLREAYGGPSRPRALPRIDAASACVSTQRHSHCAPLHSSA